MNDKKPTSSVYNISNFLEITGLLFIKIHLDMTKQVGSQSKSIKTTTPNI